MDTIDFLELIIWVGLIVMAGVFFWEWGADWNEEFRRDDDEWWESLTDESKASMQQELKTHGERLDEHEKKINALDESGVTVDSKNGTS